MSGRAPVASRGRALGPWLAYVAVLALVPIAGPSGFTLGLATQVCIAIVTLLSFNLLLGSGGMLSFGHAVYTGLGAYAAIHAMNAAARGQVHLPVILVPLVGGLAGGAMACLIGSLTTRRAGTTFAMITLGLGELVYALASMSTRFFGGEGGVSSNRVFGAPFMGLTFGPERELYGLVAVYCVLCTAALWGLRRTPFGRALDAVRDNPERASFIGLSARRVRFRAFMWAGFFAGIAGGLFALTFEIVTPDALSPLRSGNILLFALLGGSGFFVGPIVGAVAMVLVSALLPMATKAWLLYLGLVFMAVIVVEPGGLCALAVKRWWPFWRSALARDPTHRLPLPWLALSGMAVLCAVGAAAALIEMTYRIRLDASLGPSLRFLGLSLDVFAPMTWILALMVLAIASAAWVAARSRLRATPVAGEAGS